MNISQQDIISFTYIFAVFAGLITVAGLTLVYLDKKAGRKNIKRSKKR